MSRFIDKLKQLSQAESQPIGFKTKQSTPAKPKIQLVASLTQPSAEELTDYLAGADAGLLRISALSSGAKTGPKLSQTVSAIPWGWWWQGGQEEIKQLAKLNGDFVVFPAAKTPLTALQNDQVGKILEVEASLAEGLLRAVNELPIDAVLIASEESTDYFLTWQHLMRFRRLADILTKPLLASIPPNVTAGELQALWEAGINGVIVEISAGQPQGRLKELRQIIDKLTFASPRQRQKAEPLRPHIALETSLPAIDEEEEE